MPQRVPGSCLAEKGGSPTPPRSASESHCEQLTQHWLGDDPCLRHAPVFEGDGDSELGNAVCN